MKNWKYVLPTILGVVVLALISYSISLKQPSSKLLVVPSSETLTAVASTFYQVEPDSTTGRWIDYGDPELYKAGALAYVTPPVGVQPAQVNIEGVLFPNYACYLDVECRSDWIRVADKDSWDSDPRYNLVATFSVPSPTPYPVCTPVNCPNGELVCPKADCLGGCGMVCVELPPSLECVEVTWDKGTEFAGLNLREKPSMKNDNRYFSNNPLGLLYKGNVFRPLNIVENSEGTFAQYSNNGWIAMTLSDGRSFSVFASCPDG